MNYFQLFGIAPTFFPDAKVLRTKFLELSRQHHPDYFVHADPDAQQDALEQTAQINKAYKMLSNPGRVAEYLLQQRGLIHADEKYNLPPDFLMEMMELNEAAEGGASLEQEIDAIDKDLNASVRPIMENFNDQTTDNKDLEAVKEWWYKKKYLQRLKDQSAQNS